MRTRGRWIVAVGLMAACGGSPKPAGAPEVRTSSKADPGKVDEAKDQPAAEGAGEAAKETAAKGMPSQCGKASTADVCLPPAYLANGLCNGDYPTVALFMFAHGTPWKRAFSVTKSEAWNASGGGSSNEKMQLYEEILVLRQRVAKAGGIQVSGAGTSYDVLRWDGACVTLQEGELTFQTPPTVRAARVVFKRLEPHVRDKLKEAPELRDTYRAHRKECKGVDFGAVSKKCEKLTFQLSDAIVGYVRDKGGVPEPHKLPKP